MWQVGYVIEQQDRTFRVARAIAADLQRGDYESIGPKLANVTTTLASQADLIAGMALVLGALPEDQLEKALASAGASLESSGGST